MSMFSNLWEKLQEKKYCDSFVEGQIKTGLPFQIRAMRNTRGWTQADLGRRVGMPQAIISRIENPDSGHASLKTFLRVASAFDVALIVRFAPYSELASWVEGKPYEVRGLSPEYLAVPGFNDEVSRSQAQLQVVITPLHLQASSPLPSISLPKKGGNAGVIWELSGPSALLNRPILEKF